MIVANAGFLSIALGLAMIFGSRRYIQQHGKNDGRRMRLFITQNVLWKAQFVFRPCIIGGLVYLSTAYNPYASVLLVPFAFNFGVEPWDLPQDLVSLTCFYLHHMAPLLRVAFQSNNDNRNNSSANVSQALLFAHAWMLHPIGFLHHKQLVDKQALFWPYMMLGLGCKTYWWWQIMMMMMMTTTTAVAENSVSWWMGVVIPICLQFVGRWGLYLRLCDLQGLHNPNHALHDKFEWRKQSVEFVAFVLSYLFVSTYHAKTSFMVINGSTLD